MNDIPLPEVPQFEQKSALSAPTKRALIFLGVLVVVLGVAFIGALAYAKTYEDRVMPGVYVGEIYIGGMTENELKEYLLTIDDKLSREGVQFSVQAGDRKENIVLQPKGERFVSIQVDDATAYLMTYGKSSSSVVHAWQTLNHAFSKTHVPLTQVSINTQLVANELKQLLEPFETETKNAGIAVTSVDPFTYTVTPSSAGIEFHYDDIAQQIVAAWSELAAPKLSITAEATSPSIDEAEVAMIAERATVIVAGGPMTLTYTDEQSKKPYTWGVTKDKLASWLEPQEKDGEVVFGIKKDPAEQYLKDVVIPYVYKEPRNATFRMEGERVVEFVGSRDGVTVNIDDAYASMNAIVMNRHKGETVSSTVPLVVSTVAPKISTAQANTLGIEEVLGVGYSSYKGSPANRIKNIRFAVKDKLNGILVKPGETFSMLHALQPFTEAAGYLPELVIKGDRIKPEVGGGLCQVGSTMFRAAMNSGMPIEERRNHSLTVSYYNDPRNNLPGTDATIYDPAPDFKFKNDTEGYILIATEMNEKTQELFFTLWGQSDGRKASYTPPVVHKWIPTGPTKEVFTDELAPGVKKCQEPHIGAQTSFTYTIELPSGEKKERVFESYYRPLPRICLVGGAPAAAPVEGEAVAAPGDPAAGPAAAEPLLVE